MFPWMCPFSAMPRIRVGGTVICFDIPFVTGFKLLVKHVFNIILMCILNILQNCPFPTMTLCFCQVHMVGHTGRYSTGQCHLIGPTNAEINNDSCLRIQEPVRHVRGSVSKERSSLGHDTRTECAGLRFVCPQCQRTLSSLGGLTAHVKRVHQKLTRYQCQHCGKGYSHHINYLDHLATHTGSKRHVCPVCQQQFTLKCSLKTHMLQFHSKGY